MTVDSSNLLDLDTLPLTGHHLIEASAGTGKTYSITRIYLRLLIERQLDVKQILVMTFTRAATEELRGRIAKEIRQALTDWPPQKDRFYLNLLDKFSSEEIYSRLKSALLNLDEAAIYTIHGFCKRILTQQAFNSGIDFNVQMEADTSEIEIEAIRDWYRRLAHNEDDYLLLTSQWAWPEDFYFAFKSLLSQSKSIDIKTRDMIQTDFYRLKEQSLQSLVTQQAFIFEQLIDKHKQQADREQEWQELIDWLKHNDDQALSIQATSIQAISIKAMPKAASNVFDGKRYSRKPIDIKEQLVSFFEPLKTVKDLAQKIDSQLIKAEAYELAKSGIEWIKASIKSAKQQAKVMNYDDLIINLASKLDKVESPETYHQLANLIRQQFPVALVDEFQDTDPNQYDILKAIYKNGAQDATALYLIGDPKQAIYAFRSGDVFTYLKARDDADYYWQMNTNWRSSSAMILAYNRLFYGAALDTEPADVFGFNIPYFPVQSAGLADEVCLADDHNPSALTFAYFPFNEEYKAGRGKTNEMNQTFCSVMASWCVQEVDRLLNKPVTLNEQALAEQDIAILVRDKKEAQYMQDAFSMAGYATVYLSNHENVFHSSQAQELLLALIGIIDMEDDNALTASLSTRYMGCDATQLAAIQADEQLWENYRDKIFSLREIWFNKGFMAMALSMVHDSYLPETDTHERSLTNTIHLFELLQQASQQHKQPEQLLNWFKEQINLPFTQPESEMRLESDANLIRIVTQHGAKGLEYPVVFVPFATRYKDPAKFGNRYIELFSYHDRQSYELNYFMGFDADILNLYQEEAWAESIRLLYVAITRAEQRCYICVTPFTDTKHSPLGQVLKLNNSEELLEKMLELQDVGEAIKIDIVNETEFHAIHKQTTAENQQLAAAQFTGSIERDWWLSSFTALTKNKRHGGLSMPDRDQFQHGIEEENQSPEESQLIQFNLTKGAETGNLLHEILQVVDFNLPDWQNALMRPLARYKESLDNKQQEQLISWLKNCLQTPLPMGVSLNQLTWSNTLRESEFYFPMEQTRMFELQQLLLKHRANRNKLAATDDHVEQYNSTGQLELPGQSVLKGMMHGFIDLVFHHDNRYYIVDYKSNHLGDDFKDYHTPHLERSVSDNYYDLQYMLYSLALHRYLKNRLENYDMKQHFGGVCYLYLRGMQENDNTGIFYTTIDEHVMLQLDAIFSDNTHKK